MWPFGEQKTATILDTPPAAALDRVAEAHREMAAAKAALDQVGREIKSFRTAFFIFTDIFDRITSCLATSVTAKREIDRQWSILQKRKGQALHTFSQKTKIWSDAKEAAKNDSRNS